MNRIKYLFFALFIVLISVQCGDDDDANLSGPPLRDEGEVYLENQVEINDFLESNYFTLEENDANPNFNRVVFKSLNDLDAPADAVPLIESEFLQSKTLTRNDIEYEIFFLLIREGATTERKPFLADSVLVTYEGRTLEGQIFDGSVNPTWLDLSNSVVGFREAMVELSGSSGFAENPDGTFAFNDDFGIGAVFIPSGLGYFAAPPANSGIFRYAPIMFTFQQYRSRLTDHDRDGIPSYLEDVNQNRRFDDDDTDRNGVFNYLDADDDGDGVLTRDEIIIEEDGTLVFPDSNGNGTPDYLDNTFPE